MKKVFRYHLIIGYHNVQGVKKVQVESQGTQIWEYFVFVLVVTSMHLLDEYLFKYMLDIFVKIWKCDKFSNIYHVCKANVHEFVQR